MASQPVDTIPGGALYDIPKAQRRNRIMLVIGIFLFLGALSLFVAGSRGLVGWAVLISGAVNLLSAIVGRRALSRLSAASTHLDNAG